MVRVIAALLVGLLLCAQTPMLPGFPPGTFQNRAALDATPAAGYTGPVDINGTAFAIWSTRCSSTGYTGNVIDIYAPADASHTLITCSSGGALNETLQALATTCAVSCTAKTIYDQSGSNSCSGSTACDLVQTTIALRPVVTLNCLNSKICLAFNTNLTMASANGVSLSQAFTVSVVANRTGNTSAFNNILGGDSSSTTLAFNNAVNQITMYAGSATPVATANDSTTHAIQALFNAASSSFYVDGSSTAASTSPGTSGFNGTDKFNIGVNAGNTFIGNWFEVGVWNSDKTANNSSMNGNQHTYWSF